jgi:hypothetical protein
MSVIRSRGNVDLDIGIAFGEHRQHRRQEDRGGLGDDVEPDAPDGRVTVAVQVLDRLVDRPERV